jgi:hypothetical protein
MRRPGAWHADCHDDIEVFVVFHHRKPRYDSDETAGLHAARKYAQPVDVPESPIDWTGRLKELSPKPGGDCQTVSMEPAARPRHPAAQQLVVRPPEPGETWPLTDVYVELVWAHRLGPSATLAARHIGRHLERYPNGGTLNLDTLAKSIGLSRPDAPPSPEVGRNSTIVNSIHRLAYFGVLEWSPDDATITTSGKTRGMSGPQLRNAPPAVQQLHYAFLAASVGIDLKPASQLERAARRLQPTLATRPFEPATGRSR